MLKAYYAKENRHNSPKPSPGVQPAPDPCRESQSSPQCTLSVSVKVFHKVVADAAASLQQRRRARPGPKVPNEEALW